MPPEIDLTRPSPARVYDYLLGGTANWPIDREFGARLIKRLPIVRDIALANRMFLHRVVRHLTASGLRQFLDIGAGVPSVGSTHQMADQVATDTRVVYVDNDPVAVSHAQLLLSREGDADRHAVIKADLREPDNLWRKALATGILDPDEPLGLLLIGVLHFHHADADGNEIGAQCAARYRDLIPPGSWLAISHITDDGIPTELTGQVAEVKSLGDSTDGIQLNLRARRDIDALFGDFGLLEPGTTWVPTWHPEEADPAAPAISFPTPQHAIIWAGVAQKPVQ